MRLRDAQAVYDRYPALKSDGVIYASVAQVVADLEQQLAQATERERIAAAAYDGQQSSQRELEALYQAATERAERAENRQRDMVRTLLHTYVRLFPTLEFVSYEQALAVIEQHWTVLFGDALAMADALHAYFKARESTEPHDTPEYLNPIVEAWRAYIAHADGGLL